MRILGVDPGSRVTGYGVLEWQQGRVVYVASGVIRLEQGALPERLHTLFHGLAEITLMYRPDDSAIEQVFVSRNSDSALKLGQARGVAVLALAEGGMPVAEYSARQIKKAVTGNGAADKQQVQQMVVRLLELDATPRADAADALAVALCHLHSSQVLRHLAGARGIRRGRLQG